MSEHERAVSDQKTDEVAAAGRTSARRPLVNGFWPVVVIGGSAVLTAMTIGFALRSQSQTTAAQTATSEKNQVAAVKDDLAERAIALCSSGGPELEKLREVGLCQKAVEARREPTPAPSPEVSFSVVKDAVVAYLAANPPKDGHTPTAAELLPIVQQVYRQNPPKDGKTPSDAEILAVIRQVYAADPPAAGKDGTNGRDGKNAPCIAADADKPAADQCRGPAGRDGADGAAGQPGAAGVSVMGVRAATREGVCYLDFAMSNGTVISAEVSPLVCQQPAVPLVPRPSR
jgi:hypothetical protein